MQVAAVEQRAKMNQRVGKVALLFDGGDQLERPGVNSAAVAIVADTAIVGVGLVEGGLQTFDVA